MTTIIYCTLAGLGCVSLLAIARAASLRKPHGPPSNPGEEAPPWVPPHPVSRAPTPPPVSRTMTPQGGQLVGGALDVGEPTEAEQERARRMVQAALGELADLEPPPDPMLMCAAYVCTDPRCRACATDELVTYDVRAGYWAWAGLEVTHG